MVETSVSTDKTYRYIIHCRGDGCLTGRIFDAAFWAARINSIQLNLHEFRNIGDDFLWRRRRWHLKIEFRGRSRVSQQRWILNRGHIQRAATFGIVVCDCGQRHIAIGFDLIQFGRGRFFQNRYHRRFHDFVNVVFDFVDIGGLYRMMMCFRCNL